MSTPRTPDQQEPHVLVVGEDGPVTLAAIESMVSSDLAYAEAHDLASARRMLSGHAYSVVLVQPVVEGESGLEFMKDIARDAYPARCVVISGSRAPAMLKAATRAGASDVIDLVADPELLATRVLALLGDIPADEARRQRLRKLRDACLALNASCSQVSSQLESLCEGMNGGHQAINTRVNEAVLQSEFQTLVRQELDIEDLLRTTLQFLLTRTGPTNAAVFLPDSDDAYVLGAYVDANCPRSEAEQALEEIARQPCHCIAAGNTIRTFRNGEGFAAWAELDTAFFKSWNVVAVPCCEGTRCMAVIILFRDQDDPIGDAVLSQLELLRPIIAGQLDRLVAVHHRLMPEWPGNGLDHGDEYDYGSDCAA